MSTDRTSAEIALRKSILDAINNSSGMKSTELAVKVLGTNGVIDNTYADALDALIEEGEIVEIQYTCPPMDHIKRFFLLPKMSKIALLRAGRTCLMFTPNGEPAHVEKETSGLEDFVSLSADPEDPNTIKIHFGRPATDDDRVAIVRAFNNDITAGR